MENRKIRFNNISFDDLEKTVSLNFLVGTMSGGGYSDSAKITYEAFFNFVDLSKLKDIFIPKQLNSKP